MSFSLWARMVEVPNGYCGARPEQSGRKHAAAGDSTQDVRFALVTGTYADGAESDGAFGHAGSRGPWRIYKVYGVGVKESGQARRRGGNGTTTRLRRNEAQT